MLLASKLLLVIFLTMKSETAIEFITQSILVFLIIFVIMFSNSIVPSISITLTLTLSGLNDLFEQI
ncbi:hypothetical protein D3C72_1512440 [compost metagenome]